MAALLKRSYGTGRRKQAVARVYLQKGEGAINVNGRPYKDYFSRETAQMVVCGPLVEVGATGGFDITITVKGGGKSSQAGAVSLGIARALLGDDEANKPCLRQAGLLTRDSREVERKKVGLKKARKASQFSKR